MTAIEALVKTHAGNALGMESVDFRCFSSTDSARRELEALLCLKNGFTAFHSALHVFPASSSSAGYNLIQWNAPDLWKNTYPPAIQGILCFAENLLGEQFCIFKSHVGILNPETGDIDQMADTLEEWAALITSDPHQYLAMGLAIEWQEKNGELPVGQQLVPKIPFVCGGEFEIENLYAFESSRSMRWRGELASQIQGLPDGTPIRFEPLGDT
jgi:hypothetical protein